MRSDPPHWYSFFFTTIRHHSLHHSTDYRATRRNYGNSLILLDRIFGTYRSGEGVIVGQGDRKRLSIWEQTIFPFQPLIDAVKAPPRQGREGGLTWRRQAEDGLRVARSSGAATICLPRSRKGR